jgi:hypothetical protein
VELAAVDMEQRRRACKALSAEAVEQSNHQRRMDQTLAAVRLLQVRKSALGHRMMLQGKGSQVSAALWPAAHTLARKPAAELPARSKDSARPCTDLLLAPVVRVSEIRRVVPIVALPAMTSCSRRQPRISIPYRFACAMHFA